MKLITAIVNDQDGLKVLDALNKEGFSVTKLATTGSFLKVGNMTLIIGTEDELVQKAIDIIKEKCHRRKQVVITPAILETAGGFMTKPTEVDVGGATIFVQDIERFEKI
ncbi:MAG: hypothetical protein E7404_04425 [Ruminococcaceae bacterium]|nr:hypothetical protein [Oscillospiraceae bacterium]